MIRCWIGLHDWREAVRFLSTASHPGIDVLECRRCDTARIRLPSSS